MKSLITALTAGALLTTGAGIAHADETMGCGPGQYGCTAPGGGKNHLGQIVPSNHRPLPVPDSQPAPEPIRLP